MQFTMLLNVDDWKLRDQIIGMCFDTTSSNTGVYNGACHLFEEKMNKKLLNFACRHHFHEVIIADVFKGCMGTTSGPDVLLFKRFREEWNKIDKTNMDLSARFIKEGAVNPLIEEAISFAKIMLLSDSQPRSDYKEFLELTLIYCGVTPPRGIKFSAPGAFHHARWMSKLIYSLKIYIFKNQFKLTKKEEEGLIKFNTFSCLVYMKSWFTSPVAIDATFNDLELLKKLYEFKDINNNCADLAIAAMKRHLWYFTEEMVGISFFCEKISLEEKMNMVKNLEKPSNITNIPRLDKNMSENIQEKSISDFVTKNTNYFFTLLNININEITEKHPSEWNSSEEYLDAKEKVLAIKVINDCAERGVQLITQFNQLISTDEDQKQYLIQVVEKNRKEYPTAKKSLFC